ncbi:glycoside hydrolase family 13 protein [Acholeplasma granularum]|uniref:glycoside hydrolase family 13 protein n=1 Tax=Acholeplasma granularum TaxID=264635 RepID=UPI0004B2F9F3|nr:alpha-glucosidase [Acholeplasma granularum]
MKKWWMEAIGYQIYIKSFKDGNNDGIGDLKGITDKLDYLHLLGVNLIWITPFYDSPMDDNGYDVRDYFKVADCYGSIDDFKILLSKAKKLNIKVILDFVLNHTSDEHNWFLESRKSKNNPYRDYYIWQKPKVIDGMNHPPTNWGSFFGGSAWKYDEITNEYYMKIFSDKMPDLNWKNDKVIESMIDIGKWWLDLGIDGFRLDAVSHLSKAPFEDSKFSNDIVLDWFKFSNLPNNHTYLNKMYEGLFKPYDVFTIGEVGGQASIDEAIKYSAFKSNELSMVFNFDHNWHNNIHDILDLKDLKVNVLALKETLNKWQETFKKIGWLPLNWLNHDQPRLVSHYGNQNYHNESAKMLATIMYLSRGTPFIYQGEEIGMTNFPFNDLSQIDDISTLNSVKNQISKNPDNSQAIIDKALMTTRDHPRTMMQWDDTKFAGFSEVKPWFHVNPNYKIINVKDQMNDSSSIWSYYQKLFSLRRFSKYSNTLIYGTYEMIHKDDPNLFIYLRKSDNEKILVMGSFSSQNQSFDTSNYPILEVIIQNYDDISIENQIINLRPYESISYKVKEQK